MENSSNNSPKNQNQGKEGSSSVGHQSKFFKQLSSLPIINAVIMFTVNIYAQAKSSLWIVGKASDWVEKLLTTCAVPILNQLGPFAASPLAKVDDLATKGLVTLEQKVPAIKKQPQEIVSDTRELISSKVTPAVERLSNASEQVLSNKFVQLPCDVVEKLLSSGSVIVDNVLSSEKPSQNGQPHRGFPVEEKPENKSARAAWLAKEVYFFTWNTAQKLYGYVQAKTGSHGGSDAVLRKSL